MSANVSTSRAWRWLRRCTQLVLPAAVVLSPFLGGWQRLSRSELAAWDSAGWDLPAPIVDRLPRGDAPAAAYDAIVIAGGGSAAEYFSIPIVDPVAGTLALTAGVDVAGRTLLALAAVFLVAAITGRAFCGWFCPFGTLARIVEFVVERLPVQPPRFKVPRRRPLRFMLLTVALAAGSAGSQIVLALALPHLLVQQAGYGMWLMGGGGAAAGALFGLLVAGVLFGPTTYCATLCPTGAALSLAGRRRPVRLTLIKPGSCGTHCDLCDHACWLSLHPSTGDAGPDCDACGRCAEVCPHDNLEVGAVGRIRKRSAAALVASLLLFAPTVAEAQIYDGHFRPALVMESQRQLADVDVHVAVVDMSKVSLDPDDPRRERGVEISVFLARGPEGAADELGRRAERHVYRGPLVVHIEPLDTRAHRLEFAVPNHPVSTPHRTVYRRRVDAVLAPGSTIRIDAIDGWLDAPAVWVVPSAKTSGGARTLGYALAAGLLFAGLLSLALAGERQIDSPVAERPRET